MTRHRHRDPAAAYADAIDNPCPTCGAQPGAFCTNPINTRPRRIPCLHRSDSGHNHHHTHDTTQERDQ